MLRTRVIPVLLLKQQGLYKTVKFDHPKYVGDPINAIKIFNEKEVDELMVLDIESTRQGTDPNYDMIEACASQSFMPVTYGGGVKTVKQMRKIFSLGIEKIAINHSFLSNSDLIQHASQEFGNQSVVGSIDIKRSLFGSYQIYNHVTKKIEKTSIETYLKTLTDQGVGEIFINDVDRDGTMNGYDLKLVEYVVNSVDVPVIICGGASSLDDFQAAHKAKVSACAAGSMFVFHGKHKAVLITYPEYETLENLFQ